MNASRDGTASVAIALATFVLASCGGDEQAKAPADGLVAAAPAVAKACAAAASRSSFPVRCPPRLPSGEPKVKSFSRPPGVYLLDVSNGFRRRGPHVFHLDVGGQSRPFRLPQGGVDRDLRISTRLRTISIRGGGRFVQERPSRLLGWATVGGERAAILRAAPYPQGGLHGGHVLVLWNEGDHGYVVSVHGTRMPLAQQRRIALAVARTRS